ncbi:MAG: CU044_5270 family protein [Rhodoglobus sp.]
MDELTLLRKVRNDVADPTTEALTAGRAALFNTINGVEPARRTRRRGVKIAGLSALGAGALTIALVATNVVGLPDWRGGAEPAAAEVLHNAALATIETSDPVIGPGQFLRLATTAMGAAGFPSDTGRTNFLWIVSDELYIPANRDEDWVWDRHPLELYGTFGPESEAVVKASIDASEGTEELLRAPAGGFYGGNTDARDGLLEGLPRDPVQLLNHIREITVGQSHSPDDAAMTFIVERLQTGAVPADLRAAFYNAAALIPGVTITEKQATLNGQTGIAIGRDEANLERQEIIIDPESGMYIGRRQLTLSGYDDVPAGTVTGWSTITATVVDSAPEGGTVYGNHEGNG